MARSEPPTPRIWTEDELRADAETSLGRFVSARTAEGGWVYSEIFDRSLAVVERVFDGSEGLTEIGPYLFLGVPELVDPARFLTAPPVSRDDLKTLCGGRQSVRTEAEAEWVAEVIRENLDPRRFPWLDEGRQPTAAERTAATRWTASVWAIEQTRTKRRTEAGKRQEDAVAKLLESLEFVQSRREDEIADVGHAVGDIRSVDELRRGTYRRETKVAGTKSDVPVRLRDGRLLSIECKESNTAVNSTKRLNRETGGKAAVWREAFGQQVVTMAVIAGVFNLGDLARAQNDQGVFLVWEHRLSPLREFVLATSS